MALKSMTGFARSETRIDHSIWHIEIKSVNGRNLDLRVRVPDGYEFLDPMIRAETGKYLRRGSVTIAITQTRDGGDAVDFNPDLLTQILDLRKKLGDAVDASPPKLESLLALPGMMRVAHADLPDQNQFAVRLMADLFIPAIQSLDKMRCGEGANLTPILQSQINHIAALVVRAESRLIPQAESMKKRIADQLTAVTSVAAIDPARLAQELAMLAIKVDVREELDRLLSHIKTAQSLFKSGEAAGRKLDFLAQEFNREANTLCAKSADVELTEIGLDLKNTIDQFREQVQNIE